MKSQVSDDAVPHPIPVPAPVRRRMPAGTAPIVRVAEGTRPVQQLVAARRWLRFTVASVLVLSVSTIVAYMMYARAARREELAAHYPVLASARDADVIERQAARWSAGTPRLLRALAAAPAPALDSLVGAGACPFTGTGLAFQSSSDLVPTVREAIADTLTSAARGRFTSPAAVSALVAQLTGPIVVTSAGVRYAYDPATASLACAGTATLRAVE